MRRADASGKPLAGDSIATDFATGRVHVTAPTRTRSVRWTRRDADGLAGASAASSQRAAEIAAAGSVAICVCGGRKYKLYFIKLRSGRVAPRCGARPGGSFEISRYRDVCRAGRPCVASCRGALNRGPACVWMCRPDKGGSEQDLGRREGCVPRIPCAWPLDSGACGQPVTREAPPVCSCRWAACARSGERTVAAAQAKVLRTARETRSGGTEAGKMGRVDGLE